MVKSGDGGWGMDHFPTFPFPSSITTHFYTQYHPLQPNKPQTMSTDTTSIDTIADAAVVAAAKRPRRSAGSSGVGSIPEVAFASACRAAQNRLCKEFPRPKETRARLRRTPGAKRRMREHAKAYALAVAQWMTVVTDGCHQTASERHADLAHALATTQGDKDPLSFYGGERGAIGVACHVTPPIPPPAPRVSDEITQTFSDDEE